MDNSIACIYTSHMYVYCEQVDGSYKTVGCMDSHGRGQGEKSIQLFYGIIKKHLNRCFIYIYLGLQMVVIMLLYIHQIH